MSLTHFDEKGQARMVDITGKPITERVAVIEGFVKMKPETLELILNKEIAKGDVFLGCSSSRNYGCKDDSSFNPLVPSFAYHIC